MLENHNTHFGFYVLILQIFTLVFGFVILKKYKRYILALLFFLAVGVLVWPSRLLLAHKHLMASNTSSDHPCCQVSTVTEAKNFVVDKPVVSVDIFNITNETSFFITPYFRAGIRGPPSLLLKYLTTQSV